MLLSSKTKCTKLIYALFYPICIYSLFKSELRLLSYEINHFNMSFMQILWKCWHEHVMKHLVTMEEQEGCHGGETKMVPRQHSGPGNSWRYRCKRKCDVSESCKMVGWSQLPGSHSTTAWQTRETTRKEANNIVNNHHIIMAWCTTKYDACPA